MNRQLAFQQAHNIKMTSYQRRCDVITSHRRWYDVILTLCAHWGGLGSDPTIREVGSGPDPFAFTGLIYVWAQCLYLSILKYIFIIAHVRRIWTNAVDPDLTAQNLLFGRDIQHLDSNYQFTVLWYIKMGCPFHKLGFIIIHAVMLQGYSHAYLKYCISSVYVRLL